MTQQSSPRLPGLSYWCRAALLVLARPSLWWIALCQTRRLARPRWWARKPFLPVPDPDYLQFRFDTQYGPDGRPDPRDVVSYLDWCRDGGAGSRDRSRNAPR